MTSVRPIPVTDEVAGMADTMRQLADAEAAHADRVNRAMQEPTTGVTASQIRMAEALAAHPNAAQAEARILKDLEGV